MELAFLTKVGNLMWLQSEARFPQINLILTSYSEGIRAVHKKYPQSETSPLIKRGTGDDYLIHIKLKRPLLFLINKRWHKESQTRSKK